MAIIVFLLPSEDTKLGWNQTTVQIIQPEQILLSTLTQRRVMTSSKLPYDDKVTKCGDNECVMETDIGTLGRRQFLISKLIPTVVFQYMYQFYLILLRWMLHTTSNGAR